MSTSIIQERIEQKIYLIRGKKVMLDGDLATLYGVKTKTLIQAVKRNEERFPKDFFYLLTREEVAILRSQIVTSRLQDVENKEVTNLRYQIGTSSLQDDVNKEVTNFREFKQISSNTYGGRRYQIFAFTEQGIAMLSSVLKSKRAVQVNIQIMRTFTRLRELLASNELLRSKIEEMEKKYDQQFQVVFEAIKKLIEPEPEKPKRQIGFHAKQTASAKIQSEVMR